MGQEAIYRHFPTRSKPSHHGHRVLYWPTFVEGAVARLIKVDQVFKKLTGHHLHPHGWESAALPGPGHQDWLAPARPAGLEREYLAEQHHCRTAGLAEASVGGGSSKSLNGPTGLIFNTDGGAYRQRSSPWLVRPLPGLWACRTCRGSKSMPWKKVAWYLAAQLHQDGCGGASTRLRGGRCILKLVSLNCHT